MLKCRYHFDNFGYLCYYVLRTEKLGVFLSVKT